jgi:hypothetical protein
MTAPTTISVLFKSGQRQNIACTSHEDASRIVLEIATYMMEGLPIISVEDCTISVEDCTTAVVLAVGEIACVALGDQVPQQQERPIERPRPQPVPARVERGTLTAN